jgi:hypothetical protein
LVLDWGDATVASPVDSAEVGLIEGDWLSVILNWLGTHHLLGLSLSHGGEHTVTELVVALVVVLELDLSILLLEDLESEVELLFGSVGETLHFHMVVELLLENVHFLWLEHVLETEDGGGFGKVHHL